MIQLQLKTYSEHKRPDLGLPRKSSQYRAASKTDVR